jgi:hypothetical protein
LAVLAEPVEVAVVRAALGTMVAVATTAGVGAPGVGGPEEVDTELDIKVPRYTYYILNLYNNKAILIILAFVCFVMWLVFSDLCILVCCKLLKISMLCVFVITKY